MLQVMQIIYINFDAVTSQSNNATPRQQQAKVFLSNSTITYWKSSYATSAQQKKMQFFIMVLVLFLLEV